MNKIQFEDEEQTLSFLKDVIRPPFIINENYPVNDVVSDYVESLENELRRIENEQNTI